MISQLSHEEEELKDELAQL
jgi:hypothetical protein